MKIKTCCLSSFIIIALTMLLLPSCKTIDVYEKTVSFPDFKWKSTNKPQFQFTISDTVSQYQLYLILRHNEKYNYNNIYFSLYTRFGNDTATHKVTLSAVLATNDKGWLGTAMDDIYDHRIKLGSPQTLRRGNYYFTLEQIMREDPLMHVLDAGIRVEKRSNP